MARKAMSVEERKMYYQQVANQHGFTLLEECISNRQKVLMQCNKHPMYKTAITLYSLKKRHFCPYCANEKGHTQGRKIPYDIVKKDFHTVGYILLTTENEYKNSLQKLRYLCPKHGEQQITYGHLTEGKRCRLCAKDEMSKKIN